MGQSSLKANECNKNLHLITRCIVDPDWKSEMPVLCKSIQCLQDILYMLGIPSSLLSITKKLIVLYGDQNYSPQLFICYSVIQIFTNVLLFEF